VLNKLYEEKVEANLESQHIFMRTLNQYSLDITTRKVELCYYPVFKGSKIPTNEELVSFSLIHFHKSSPTLLHGIYFLIFRMPNK